MDINKSMKREQASFKKRHGMGVSGRSVFTIQRVQGKRADAIKGRVTVGDVRNHISKCKRLGVRYDWLGFVEDKDLTPEVEALFKVGTGWNWVHGNSELRKMEVFVK